MKKLAVLLTLLGLGSATSQAFTFGDGDLLLVFRKDGFNDVTFNIGSVSNFLGKASGTALTVSNFDLAAAKANFNNSLSDVKFILLAATSSTDAQKRLWASNASTTSTPTDVTGSKWSQEQSKVFDVGIQAAVNTGTNAVQKFVVSPSDRSSYTYIASEGGSLDIATLAGSMAFPVENTIPAASRFFEIKANNTRPAAALVGSFAMTSAGVLTFTAGAPVVAITSPTISTINHLGTSTTVSFSTQSGVTYKLSYTSALGTGAAWTPISGSVAGTGTTGTLTDTAAGAGNRFYRIEASR